MKIVLALISLVLLVTPARADPVSLIATVIATLLPSIGPVSLAAGAGFGFGATTWTIAQVAAYATLAAGAIGLNALLAPKLPSVPQPGAAKETFSTTDGPEIRALGRVRVGGLKAYGNTAGLNRYRLILHCKGLIDAIEEYYLGGRSVTVDDDGAVSSPPWTKVGGSYAYLQSKLGTGSETAWPDLIADFPDLWTSNHRARGIAQTLAKFINPGLSSPKFLALYQNGVPDLEVVLRAEKLYDPRSDTTVWSDNGILAALHVLLTSYTFLTLDDFDIDFLKSEADRADAFIRTKSGLIPRSRAWGIWTSETARGENMQALLDSIGAEIVARPNNKIGIALIDDEPKSELTIAARDIVSVNWQSGPSGVQRPNRCTVTYYSPERNYDKGSPDLSETDWSHVDSEIESYGEQKLDLQLSFCPASGQAQRRARQMFALARADSGLIRTNMSGIACFGCDYVSFEFPDGHGTFLCKIGSPRVLDDQGQVEIPFVVWPSLSAWNVNKDEADAPEQIPDLIWGGGLTKPNAPTGGVVVTYPDTSVVTRIGYTVPSDADGGTVEAVYRTTAGVPSAWQGMTEYLSDGYGFPVSGQVPHAYVELDLSETECEFRIRTFSANGQNGSGWSDSLNVTPIADNSAPDAPIFADGTQLVAPASLNVSYVVIGDGDPIAVKPGEVVPTGSDGSVALTARAFSSNGTASAEATYTPPPPP